MHLLGEWHILNLSSDGHLHLASTHWTRTLNGSEVLGSAMDVLKVWLFVRMHAWTSDIIFDTPIFFKTVRLYYLGPRLGLLVGLVVVFVPSQFYHGFISG